jgi:hypothetical protein
MDTTWTTSSIASHRLRLDDMGVVLPYLTADWQATNDIRDQITKAGLPGMGDWVYGALEDLERCRMVHRQESEWTPFKPYHWTLAR